VSPTGNVLPNPGVFIGPLGPVQLWAEDISLAESYASQASLQAHSKTTASANLYATLGEMPETIGLIKDIFRSLMKIVIYMKKRQFLKLWKYLKKADLIDLRMTYRYGIRPLAYDLQSYQNVLDSISQKVEKFTAKSGTSFSRVINDRSTAIDVPYPGMSCGYTRSHNMSGTAGAGVVYNVENMGLDVTLGLYEIPQAIWELTTLSFVLDWFCNVGTIISALMPKAGLSKQFAWKSFRFFSQTKYTSTGELSYPQWACWETERRLSGWQYTVNYVYKSRVPVPNILDDFQILKPEVKLSLNQIGDIASIIRGFLRR
jgi:hypothetical protein